MSRQEDAEPQRKLSRGGCEPRDVEPQDIWTDEWTGELRSILRVIESEKSVRGVVMRKAKEMGNNTVP